MSSFSLAISPGRFLSWVSMNGTPPTPEFGRRRASFIFSDAMISRLGLAWAYTSLPCQWSQWKCVLMIFRTGFLETAWISLYRARAADGFEWESTTTTPSLVSMTAALELTLYRTAATAAHTPSPTFLSSKDSAPAVWAYALTPQQSSWGSSVYTAAAIVAWARTCRRVNPSASSCLLSRSATASPGRSERPG